MRKCAVCVIALLFLITVLGCAPTTHTEKSTYQAGETIRVYDNETGACLGVLEITNVHILRDEPYTSMDFLRYKQDGEESQENQDAMSDDSLVYIGNKIYRRTEYAAVVQIDFKAETMDSLDSITKRNFSIVDCNKHFVDEEVDVDCSRVPTSDSSFIVGLEELGDIYIGFSFHGFQKQICKIVCEYDENTKSYRIK